MTESPFSLIWPPSPQGQVVTEDDLESFYAYPESIDRPYVRLNYISSLNGKISVDGRSGGLGDLSDKLAFRRMRRRADVVLVASRTVTADGYRGARSSAALREARGRRGQPEVLPIAVVTGSATLDPGGPLFTDALIPPLVLTVASAPPANVERLRAAGADVAFVGEERADMRQALDALGSRGLRRILCEGGPSLFGQLHDADAVDEVCLTLSPNMGGDGPISPDSPRLSAMRIETVLARDDSLLIRYTRKR